MHPPRHRDDELSTNGSRIHRHHHPLGCAVNGVDPDVVAHSASNAMNPRRSRVDEHLSYTRSPGSASRRRIATVTRSPDVHLVWRSLPVAHEARDRGWGEVGWRRSLPGSPPPRGVQPRYSCLVSRCQSRTWIVNATAKPIVVATPTHLPPSSYASGIIVLASMVRIAPAANASTKATTSGDECWNST